MFNLFLSYLLLYLNFSNSKPIYTFSSPKALKTDTEQWIEVELSSEAQISHVATQGENSDSFVSSYSIRYATEGSDDYSNIVDDNDNIVVSKNTITRT